MTSGLVPGRFGERVHPAVRTRRPAASSRRVNTSDAGVHFLAWVSPDGRRSETARVVLSARGLRASGTILALDDPPGATSYALLCDAAGLTRRLSVRTESPTVERALALTRAPGGPWLDGIGRPPPDPDLNRAVDIDLTSSTFTLGLTIRRLGLHTPDCPATSIDVPVAHVSTLDLGVRVTTRRLAVVGRSAGVTALELDGPDGPERLSVDADGFVVDLTPH